VDAIANSSALKESRGEFLIRNELPDRPIIALLAGSRKGEINSMMPVFMSFADKMRELPRYKDYQFIIAGAPSRSINDYEPFIGDRDSHVRIIFGQSQSIVRNAQAAVVNSGTASLETALLGTPQVVAYKGSVLNFQIAKMIIKVKFISLGNLILDRTCFRELLQYYFNADNILDEIIRILEDDAYRDKMLRGYEEIKEKLGGKGASDAVAESMINELSLGKKDS
jgi:lipid-A-disaccharide synthase